MQQVTKNIAMGVGVAVAVMVVMASTVGLIGWHRNVQYEDHIKDVDRFAKDPEWGFSRLQILANQVGQNLVLAPAEITFDQTRNVMSKRSSPAAADGEVGICVLAVSPKSIDGYVESLSPEIRKAATFGLLAHEVGHCVDVGRDMGTLAGSEGFKNSIAPVDRPSATTPITYYDVQHRGSTVLWREAYADVFSVGYWRLTHNQKDSALLIEWLYQFRSQRNHTDPHHATGCWVKSAGLASGLSSIQELPKWADYIRSNSGCNNQLG